MILSPLKRSRLSPGTPGRRRTGFTLKTRTDRTHVVWSKVIRARYGSVCQKCGRSKAQGYVIQAAHILSRGTYPQMRYHSDNGIALCALPCHRWYDEHKGDRHDGDADRWVKGKVGQAMYDYLLVQASITRKVDAKMARLHLTARLRDLQGASC